VSRPSPQPTPPSGALVGVVLWDIGALPADDLGAAYYDVAALVAWLREQGRQVPACWYVHPWVVERLLLLLHWRSVALTPAPDPSRTHPKAVTDWWAALLTLEREWTELLGHDTYHKVPGDPDGREEAIAPFEDHVADQVAARRGPTP
jgi:hypothetical protein